MKGQNITSVIQFVYINCGSTVMLHVIGMLGVFGATLHVLSIDSRCIWLTKIHLALAAGQTLTTYYNTFVPDIGISIFICFDVGNPNLQGCLQFCLLNNVLFVYYLNFFFWHNLVQLLLCVPSKHLARTSEHTAHDIAKTKDD